MKRREFITLLGGAAGVAAGGSRAAAVRCQSLGYLTGGGGCRKLDGDRLLGRGWGHKSGYVEGQNVIVEYR